MPIWLGILAGVLSDRMKEAEDRKQAAAKIQMQFAQSLDPHTPPYAYEAAQANSRIASEGGQSVAKLLPMLLGQRDSINHGPDTTPEYNPGFINPFFDQAAQRGYGGINWGARSGGIFG